MDIFDFITTFEGVYRRIQNERQYEPKEPKKHNKRTFCRELFCQIVKDDNIVMYSEGDTTKNYRTLSTFESYYSKSNRKTFHSLAGDMIAQLDVVKFMRFLVCNIRDSNKEVLLKSFQQYFPGTVKRKLFSIITREWVRIITEEANKPDGRQTKSRPIEIDAVTVLIKNIEAELRDLTTIGHKIMKSESSIQIGFPVSPSSFRLLLQSGLEKLKDLAKKLALISDDCRSTITDQIAETILGLHAESFILSESESIIKSRKNQYIFRLWELIQEFKEKQKD